jgi:hypothetical protein
MAGGAWAATSADGRYDSSEGSNSSGLHWVYGDPSRRILEAVELGQFADYYFTPGLVGRRLMGERMDSVPDLSRTALFPIVHDVSFDTGHVRARIEDRGGGIGAVAVKVDGQEVALLDGVTTVDVDVSRYLRGRDNPTVTVSASNAEGSWRSRNVEARGADRDLPTDGDLTKKRLIAIVAGIDDYAGDAIDLNFAAADANSVAQSVLLLGLGIPGVECEVHVFTDKPDSSLSRDSVIVHRPLKSEFQSVFQSVAQSEVTQNDLLLVYLAGHGVALGDKQSRYYYLTQEAQSASVQTLSNSAVRDQWTVSGEELVQWLKTVPAGKRVVFLDTCSAGAAESDVAALRGQEEDVARAVLNWQSRTGVFAIMGAPADFASYEAAEYGHGLLTYALLETFRTGNVGDDAAPDSVLVDRLFKAVRDRTVQLAAEMGRSQSPRIVSPSNDSFVLGYLDNSLRAQIPVTIKLPVISKVRLSTGANAGDPLELERSVADGLRELTLSGSKERFAAYIEREGTPGSFEVRGTYLVSGDRVEVSLALWSGGNEVKPKPKTIVASLSEVSATVLATLREWFRTR